MVIREPGRLWKTKHKLNLRVAGLPEEGSPLRPLPTSPHAIALLSSTYSSESFSSLEIGSERDRDLQYTYRIRTKQYPHHLHDQFRVFGMGSEKSTTITMAARADPTTLPAVKEQGAPGYPRHEWVYGESL